MASLYQRFSGKINTSHSFPLSAEGSRLLGAGANPEEGAAPAGAPRRYQPAKAALPDGHASDSDDDYELSSNESNNRNWKGMAIALLVIVFVCSLIVASIVLLTPPENTSLNQAKISLEDLFSDDFQLQEPDVKWISGSEVIYRTMEGHLVKMDVKENESVTLLENNFLKMNLLNSKFSMSPDRNFILLAYDIRQVYQFSYTALFTVYSLQTREFHDVLPAGEERERLQLAGWCSHAHQMVYVYNNDLYFKPDLQSAPIQITSTGKVGSVYNGISDWLYEEEVLHSSVAHWCSPDGSRLAFASINDSNVPLAEIPQYTGAVYPTSRKYPYPKAGQNNPRARLFLADLNSPSPATTELLPPETLKQREFYIPMVAWVMNSMLAVNWLSRAQNFSILTFCNASSGVCSERHKESSEAWLSGQTESPLFSPDGKRFFLPLAAKQGGRGAFHHLGMFSLQERRGHDVRFITSGDWEVTALLAHHPTQRKLYYLSTEDGPTNRHLYSVETGGSFERQCLSCGVIPNCSFHHVSFSPSTKYFLLFCDGPTVPMVTVHSTDNPGSFHILENNTELRGMLAQRQTPTTIYRNVTIEDYVVPLQLMLPAGFTEEFLYPLLLIIDGVPGDQSVSEVFGLSWEAALASGHATIVARFDGRGAGFHGSRYLHEVHRKLGTVEDHDYVTALRSLLELPYIDKNRIGVYGKGYGGYLATLVLGMGEAQARCGVAESPIFDPMLYASAFSERYLGLPAREENAYEAAKVSSRLSCLKAERFLIIHGTANEMVHFQHTAELIKHLISIDANYTLQIYPDEGNSVRELKWRRHLYKTMTDFFVDCFSQLAPRVRDEREDDDDEDE
ncbi:inactive dipeptidyl peptidase 10-like isoform X1 [Lampetra fluviatilis]